ncbi:hypothetical protein BZA70DRAFT_278857 [Myxozyma melibiosi]|uniref:Uncharacterized protein n=1 Tax=Myxozyma melibiosi TaxID=54550 RepID=A0ABR1F585_9ASCO
MQAPIKLSAAPEPNDDIDIWHQSPSEWRRSQSLEQRMARAKGVSDVKQSRRRHSMPVPVRAATSRSTAAAGAGAVKRRQESVAELRPRKRQRHSIATSTVLQNSIDMHSLFPPIGTCAKSASSDKSVKTVESIEDFQPVQQTRRFGADLTNIPSSPPVQRKTETAKIDGVLGYTSSSRLPLQTNVGGRGASARSAQRSSRSNIASKEDSEIDLRKKIDEFLGAVMASELNALTRNSTTMVRVLVNDDTPEDVKEQCRDYLKRQDQMRKVVESSIDRFGVQIAAMKEMLASCVTFSNSLAPTLTQYLPRADAQSRADADGKARR